MVTTTSTTGWAAAAVRAAARDIVRPIADAYRASSRLPQPTEDYSTTTALPADVTAPWVAAYLDDTPRGPLPVAVVVAYAALRAEVWAQHDALRAAGIVVEVVASDPYVTATGAPNSVGMMRDIVEHGRIRVLATATTGSHPVLDDATNDAFRAVHDFFGHAGTGRSFDADGEEAAYRHHRTMFTGAAIPALTTETRVQNALNNVNGNAFVPQRATIISGADA